MDTLKMQVYVMDEDGVAFQAMLQEEAGEGLGVQLGLLDNIDALSGATLLLVVAHALMLTPKGNTDLADEVYELLLRAQSLLKVRLMRDENQRTSRKRKGAGSVSSSIDDDSEIPF